MNDISELERRILYALERIDMTARLLDVRHELGWPETGPVATLRSAAAYSPCATPTLAPDST